MRRARQRHAARLECDVCGATFRNADELAAHWAAEHYAESRSE